METEASRARRAFPDPAAVTRGPSPDAKTALGAFLRARRALLTPGQAGVIAFGERRVPGLRREELADLAGLSVPYLTRLEQGRDRCPSPQVISALAAALRLDAAETRYLQRLAEPSAPPRSPVPSPVLSPATRDILASLAGHPALVLTPCRDVLAATSLATALCPGFTAGRNILRYVFLDQEAKTVYVNWPEVAAEAVRTLRAAAAPAVRDDRQRLLEELTAGSNDFASLWARHEVRDKTIGEKRFRHPVIGEIALTYATLAVNDSDGQVLSVYRAAPGSPSKQALERLRGYAFPMSTPGCPAS
jgi:transcriptional regulator with XRE-family HTH domain